ncbi:MAG: hypothetical protein ACLPVF_14250 [Acidimicrobiales bacterium]
MAPSPFVGPSPFTEDDRDRFFGRDAATAELFSLMCSFKTCVVYGQSGTGKSSLIQAGLIPKAREAGIEVLPVARVHGAENAAGGPPGAGAGADTGGGSGTGDDDPRIADYRDPFTHFTLVSWNLATGSPKTSLAEALADLPAVPDQYGDTVIRLAIFDQFEELFTAFPGYWGLRLSFVEDLREALLADPRLHVVLVVREDYLADALDVAARLPDGLRSQFRLPRLERDEAIEAIEGPVHKRSTLTFADGVVEQLVDDLMKIKIKRAGRQAEDVPGEFVEPVQLQVVCTELWRSLPAGTQVITADHLEAFGDPTHALARFYDTCVTQTARRTGVPVTYLRRWFEKVIITPAGTRALVYQGDRDTEGLPNAAVGLLEHHHMLRAEDRAGAHWYELTHDRFIAPIREANARARSLAAPSFWRAASSYWVLVPLLGAALLFGAFQLWGPQHGGAGRATLVILFLALLTFGVVQICFRFVEGRMKPFYVRGEGHRLRAVFSWVVRIGIVALVALFLITALVGIFGKQGPHDCKGSDFHAYVIGEHGACLGDAYGQLWGLGLVAWFTLGFILGVLWRPMSLRRAKRKQKRLAAAPL